MAVTIANPTAGTLQIAGAVVLCTLVGGVVTPIAAVGSGDVVGPASATDGAVAFFDGTTGKLLKSGNSLPITATTVTGTSFVATGTGGATLGGHVTTGNGNGAGYGLSLSGLAWLVATGTDTFKLWNSTFNGAPLVQFGGETNSFPALKRVATALQVRLADDGGYGAFVASGYSAGASAGVTAGPFTAITSITVTGGIITAITGT